MRSWGWLPLVGVAQLLACSQAIEFPADEKPPSVATLDKLVVEINGFDSVADYTVQHGERYVDETVTWAGADVCHTFNVVEGPTRRTTRTWDGRLVKLVLSWTSTTIVSSTTMYESYHYDDDGKLRVVVVDQEADHTTDPGYMAGVASTNAAIVQDENTMPRDTAAEQVAAINKSNEVEDGRRIFQDWLYFDASGSLIYETRRKGVEMARAANYPAIPQTFPTLYADVHPANVIGAPILTALPAHYAYLPLVEMVVDSTTTMLGSLIAADPFDGEVSLKTKPACR